MRYLTLYPSNDLFIVRCYKSVLLLKNFYIFKQRIKQKKTFFSQSYDFCQDFSVLLFQARDVHVLTYVIDSRRMIHELHY